MRHRKMLAPINSVKHYVHNTNAVIASGAVRANVIVDATAAPATANAQDVKEGAIIKAVFVEQWIRSNATSGNSVQFILIVEKVPSNQASVSAAQTLNLGAYQNKKNVLYVTQGVLGDIATNDAVPLYRNWILIPKGKQRMGLGDRVVVTVSPVGFSVQNCGISTYKEYI